MQNRAPPEQSPIQAARPDSRWPFQPGLQPGLFGQLLLAFLLVALVPLSVFWHWQRQRTLDDGRAAAESTLTLFSDRVIQQVDDWTQLNLALMQAAVAQTDMATMQAAPQRRIIATLGPRLPWAYLIHSIGLDGLNVARSDDAPPADYRDRFYYRQILAGAAYSIDVQVGRTSHRPAFLLAVPIAAPDATLRGMLVEAATLDAVTRAVTSAHLGETGFAFLMSPEGRLIAHATEPLGTELKDYSQHPAFLLARSAGEGLHRYRVDGIDRIASIRRTALGWIAVAQQDVAESEAATRRGGRHALLVLAVTATVVTLLSLLIARSFARPIEQVTKIADRISRGDLSPGPVPLRIHRPDEIGDLLRTMYSMQTALGAFVSTQQRLAKAAAHGDFSQRGDEHEFGNVFGAMVGHLNRLMETADRGLAELATVLSAIACGDLNARMSAQHEGTFAELARDTNATVAALAKLVQDIRLQRGLMQATLEHLPQGVSVVDLDLRIIAWNRRYCEIFNYPPELLEPGQPIETLIRHNATRGLMGRVDPEGEITRRLQHLRRGAIFASERELPDGTVLEIRGNAVPGVGYVTSFSDITAYKHTESELRALTESLEARVEERTRELQQATAEAERANYSKTRFVAAAVHDLMQPVNAARMFVTALRTLRTPAEQAQLLDSIDKALAAEDGILSSLLDISRLEAGTIEIQTQNLPLAPLLDTLGREFAMLAAARGLRMRTRLAQVCVHTDPTLLRRILQNFLTNALRYTEHGRILLGCRRVGTEQIRIEVWDTGPGIPESHQQVIFQEFHRLDHARTLKDSGAGLGLAIVERIGRRLGHPIGLRSWPGRGSVFSVTVPCVAVPAAITAEAPMPTIESGTEPGREHDSPLHGCRIWCLHSEPKVRDGINTLLGRWGCELQVFTDAIEMLDAAAVKSSPEMLLLDHAPTLEQSSGPNLARRLLNIWKRQLPVIVITAERSADSLVPLRETGFAVLSTPLRPAALRALMTQLLTQNRRAAN